MSLHCPFVKEVGGIRVIMASSHCTDCRSCRSPDVARGRRIGAVVPFRSMLIGIVSSGTFGCFEGNGMQLLFVPAHWAYDEAALFVRFALWPEGVQAKSRWRQRKESLAPEVVLVA